jgi:hypothetical protein
MVQVRSIVQSTAWYQVNCGTTLSHYIWHPFKTYQFLQKKSCQNTSALWRFPPRPLHHLIHEEYWYNTGSAMITLIATSSATILPLCLVRFVLFWEKLHHFYNANFVTRLPLMTRSWADRILAKVSWLIIAIPPSLFPVNHLPIVLITVFCDCLGGLLRRTSWWCFTIHIPDLTINSDTVKFEWDDLTREVLVGRWDKNVLHFQIMQLFF